LPWIDSGESPDEGLEKLADDMLASVEVEAGDDGLEEERRTCEKVTKKGSLPARERGLKLNEPPLPLAG